MGGNNYITDYESQWKGLGRVGPRWAAVNPACNGEVPPGLDAGSGAANFPKYNINYRPPTMTPALQRVHNSYRSNHSSPIHICFIQKGTKGTN